MRFWRTLIPDAPFISDYDDMLLPVPKSIPPAVSGWCFVAMVCNCVVVAIATAIYRNIAPLLVGAIFTMFPLWMLLFWRNLASTMDTVKRRTVERPPFPLPLQINVSVQWAAISLCAAAPMMTSLLLIILWFTQMKR
jgi:hypothetical protein